MGGFSQGSGDTVATRVPTRDPTQWGEFLLFLSSMPSATILIGNTFFSKYCIVLHQQVPVNKKETSAKKM